MRRRTTLTIVTAALGLLCWAVLIEPGRLVVRETRVACSGWPKGRAPLRVAVLTDLHVGSFRNELERQAEIVALTNAQRVDVIVLLGDFMHGKSPESFVAPEATAEKLAGLRARYGVVSVLGNHDWWYDGPRVRTALESAGITVLENDAVAFGAGKDRFWVAGLADLWTREVNMAAALSAVPAGEPVLLLTHNPDVFPEVPPRVTLTFAGHTHGGQVALPLIGRPIVPSRFGQRYAYGLVVEDGRSLFVSPGIGTSILPVRFRVPPEISVVVVAAKD
jgi:predicted MPP superfamily phosphohydrolase